MSGAPRQNRGEGSRYQFLADTEYSWRLRTLWRQLFSNHRLETTGQAIDLILGCSPAAPPVGFPVLRLLALEMFPHGIGPSSLVTTGWKLPGEQLILGCSSAPPTGLLPGAAVTGVGDVPAPDRPKLTADS